VAFAAAVRTTWMALVSGSEIPRAKPRANDRRRRATLGHSQPRSPQLDDTSSHFRHYPAPLRALLTSEGYGSGLVAGGVAAASVGPRFGAAPALRLAGEEDDRGGDPWGV
jgi:hypothetical protein